MQKGNSVIKNYILSSEPYLLKENHSKFTFEILKYHLLSKQNMDFSYCFLLRKSQKYH